MTAEILMNAIGEIDNKFITEARETPQKTAKRGRIGRIVAAIASVTASIGMLLGSGLYVLDRFDYLGARCGSAPGISVDGTYYY